MTTIEGSAKLVTKVIELEKRAEAAETELAASKTPCVWRWKMDDSEQHWSHWWYADCGHQQEDRPLAEWDFCPYCGHPIEVQP